MLRFSLILFTGYCLGFWTADHSRSLQVRTDTAAVTATAVDAQSRPTVKFDQRLGLDPSRALSEGEEIVE